MNVCDVKDCGERAQSHDRWDFPDFDLCKKHYELACEFFQELIEARVSEESLERDTTRSDKGLA